MDCSMPGSPVLHHLPELVSIQPSHPLSSPSPPAFYLSQLQGLFQRVGSSHLVARILELQLQHQSFQWIFRVDFLSDWLVQTLAVQGTLKSLLQHHNLKISVLQHSTYFMVQLSHLYMTTGKTTALTRWSVSGEGDMWPFTFRQWQDYMQNHP